MVAGFQTSVATQPAQAVEGDFCSTNPRFTVDAGQGALVAGPDGVYVGRFCWSAPPLDNDNAKSLVNSYGSGQVLGFVHREQQALITRFLDIASMLVPKGFAVTVYNGGDFWVRNSGSGTAQVGMKAYANFADGKVTFAAASSPTGGASSTGSIAASTFSVTGSIEGDVLDVTAVGSGTVRDGATISGTGISSETTIVGQLTPLLDGEAAGGVGRYYVSKVHDEVASTTVSGTYGTFTAGTTTGGTYGVGDVLQGTGVDAGTTITALITGTGGAGTYAVSSNTVVASTTISVAALNVETKWYAMSAGLAGELVKISDHPLG